MKYLVWVFLLVLIGCQSQPVPPTATVAPPPPLEEAATEPASVEPTLPAPTFEPDLPTVATSTPLSQPSPSATPPPAPQPSPTAVAAYTLTITEPAPDSIVTVGSTVTFRGTVDPIPADSPMLQLLAADASLPAFLGSVELDSTTGAWSLTVLDISARRTGPAQLIVSAAQSRTEIPVELVLPREADGVYVVLNEPNHGDVAVVGSAILLAGESRSPVDGQIDLVIGRCGVEAPPISQISIGVGDGPWRAQMLIPEGTPPGKICIETGSGGLSSADSAVRWFGDASLELVESEAPEAALVRVGERSTLEFIPGQTTSLYGLAVNAPDDLVNLELIDAAGTVVASSTAEVGDWGYWTGTLAVPAEVDPEGLTLNAFYIAEDGTIVGE